MKVKNLKQLWGVNISSLVRYGKRYSIISKLLYLADIIAVVLMVIQMYKKKVSFEGYFILMILTCILFVAIYGLCINAIKWGTYKFYRKHSNDIVSIKTINLSSDTLYSILYLCKCKRLKQGKDIEIYKEQLLSSCCEDAYYAKKVMKYLDKYEAEDGDVKIYCSCRFGKYYFIDFVQDKEDN